MPKLASDLRYLLKTINKMHTTLSLNRNLLKTTSNFSLPVYDNKNAVHYSNV